MKFKNYHPIINIVYFTAVIGFSCAFMHPAALVIGLISSVCCSIILIGSKAIRFNILYILPIGLLTAIINPLFSHEGQTVLAYFPNGNPLTLEAICYGVAAAIMLITVLSIFSCFNSIITSDKIVYLLGRLTPALSTILTMVLRFVPQFKNQFNKISVAQKALTTDNKGMINKAKSKIKIISAMTTWSFENAADTADSMKSRGYGLNGRTSYSNFKFTKRDVISLIYITLLSLYILAGALYGKFSFEYYPAFKTNKSDIYSLSLFFAYVLLFSEPIIIEIREAIKWKRLKSKI